MSEGLGEEWRKCKIIEEVRWRDRGEGMEEGYGGKVWRKDRIGKRERKEVKEWERGGVERENEGVEGWKVGESCYI